MVVVVSDPTSNTMEYVQIMSTGNAIDFGDLTARYAIKCWLFKWSWRFIMSEFKVNTITNRDGSYERFHRCVVLLPLEVLVCNYQVIYRVSWW